MRQVLKDHRLAGDGFVNPGSAVRLGKFIGARAIVVGKLVRHTWTRLTTTADSDGRDRGRSRDAAVALCHREDRPH